MRVRLDPVLVLCVVSAACASRESSSERRASAVSNAAPCKSGFEAQGMDSSALEHALAEAARAGKLLHGLVVMRHGCVVAESYWPPYGRERKHYLNSATKAVLSALVGVAVHDGTLREDDLVASYFPDLVPEGGDPRKQRIRIRHLLTMSSGISWPQNAKENASDEMGRSPDWVRFILDRPMAAEPGTVTNYSNGDSHLLSAILQKATGVTALELARKRLFEPLEIIDVAWDADPQGRSIGSAALQMRPVDMARLGLLYLNHGEWGSRRVLDRDWVEKSITTQVQMPTRGGAAAYGYYFWLYPERGLFEAWGGAGQRIGVFRDLDLVVVMTADIPDDFPRSPFAARIYDAVRDAVSRRL